MGRARQRVHAAADARQPGHPAPARRGWPAGRRPTALASEAPADAVRQWANLGYPRRALWLHRAAVEIRDRHGGVVPRDVDALLALSGIGDYTARAVAVFAYGDRHPVVDTNTRRVLARAVDGRSQPGPAVASATWPRWTAVLPDDDAEAAIVNAATMELGAIVCTARVSALRRLPDRGCVRLARRRLSRHRRRPPPAGALRRQRPAGAWCGAEGRCGMPRPPASGRRAARRLAGRTPARPRDHLARRRRAHRADRHGRALPHA